MKAEIAVERYRMLTMNWLIRLRPETEAEAEFLESGPDKYEIQALTYEELPGGYEYTLSPIWGDDKEADDA